MRFSLVAAASAAAEHVRSPEQVGGQSSSRRFGIWSPSLSTAWQRAISFRHGSPGAVSRRISSSRATSAGVLPMAFCTALSAKQPCDGNVSLLRRGMEGCVPPFVPRIDGRPLGDEPAGGFLFPECFLCLSFACASLSASSSEGAGPISAASWIGVLSVRPAGFPISAPCGLSAASHRAIPSDVVPRWVITASRSGFRHRSSLFRAFPTFAFEPVMFAPVHRPQAPDLPWTAAAHPFPWLGRHADRQSPPAVQDRPATVRVFHATHGSPFCRQVEQPRQSMRSF